jgi:hypothetical protein
VQGVASEGSTGPPIGTRFLLAMRSLKGSNVLMRGLEYERIKVRLREINYNKIYNFIKNEYETYFKKSSTTTIKTQST